MENKKERTKNGLIICRKLGENSDLYPCDVVDVGRDHLRVDQVFAFQKASPIREAFQVQMCST